MLLIFVPFKWNNRDLDKNKIWEGKGKRKEGRKDTSSFHSQTVDLVVVIECMGVVFPRDGNRH